MSTSKKSWTEHYKSLYVLQDKVLEIIDEAGQKKLVEEIFLVECLRTFDHNRLRNIRWIEPVNIEDFKQDRDTLIENIITRSKNKLFRTR